MQCEGIGGAIGLQIVPGQCQTWRGGETAPEALEAGLTAAFNGIEVDHHCPSALAPAGSVFSEFLGTGGEPIGVLLVILTRVLALALDLFRKAGVHP